MTLGCSLILIGVAMLAGSLGIIVMALVQINKSFDFNPDENYMNDQEEHY